MCVVWSGGSEKQSECQLLNGDPQRSREHTGHNGGADCPVATPSVTFRGQLMVHGTSSVQTDTCASDARVASSGPVDGKTSVGFIKRSK